MILSAMFLVLHIPFPYFNAEVIPSTMSFFKTSSSWEKIFFDRFATNSSRFEFMMFSWHPVVYQFWYVRNLLIFMIFSPLIKAAAERFPLSYFCVVLSGTILGMCGVFADPLWIFPAVFYFSLGFYAVRFIDRILLALDNIRWRDFLISYSAFTALRMYFDFAKISSFVGFLHCIFTILAFVKLAGVWSKNEKVFARLSKLSDFSFWIYAAHAPFVVASIKKLIIKALPMHGALILLQFFMTAALCVAFLMILGILVKKICPKLFALATGGR